METCTLRVDHRLFVVFFTLLKFVDGAFTPRTSTDSSTQPQMYYSIESTDMSEAALAEPLTTSIIEYTDRGTSANFGHTLVGITDIPQDFLETSHNDSVNGTEEKSSPEMSYSDHKTRHSTESQGLGTSWMSDSRTDTERSDFYLLPTAGEAGTIQDTPIVSRTSISDLKAQSQTDSSYVSSTISRVGERTLLSIISNSTLGYTSEDLDSSKVRFRAYVFGESVEGTSHSRVMSETDDAVSTVYDMAAVTLDSGRTENASNGKSLGTQGPDLSTGIHSRIGEPNVTQEGLRQTSSSDGLFSSTPPLIMVDSRAHVAGTSHAESGRTSRSDSQGSVGASTSTLSSPAIRQMGTTQDGVERSVTQGTLEDGSSTQLSTGSLSTGGRERTEVAQTQTDERTSIVGATTAAPSSKGGPANQDDAHSKFLAGQQPFTPDSEEATPSGKGSHYTAPESATLMPRHHTEQGGGRTGADGGNTQWPSTETPTSATTVPSATASTPPTLITTRQLEPSSTTAETHTQSTTIVTTDTTQGPPLSQQPQSTSSPPFQAHSPSGGSHPEDGKEATGGNVSTDVTTVLLETSTATPGNTTAQRRHTTASYSKSTPTRVPSVAPHPPTPSSRTVGHTTALLPATTSSTKVDVASATPAPGLPCGSLFCANGGTCVRHTGNKDTCVCLSAWTGPTCTKDVNECETNPCPVGSKCVNTHGSFSCECPLGSDLENGRECTKVKTFLGSFSMDKTAPSVRHDIEGDIKHLLNASLSILRGYIRSSCSWNENSSKEWSILAVNMFSISAEVNGTIIFNSIQVALKNCRQNPQHCRVHKHKLTYHVESLCKKQGHHCDPERSMCGDESGTPSCQCREGYYKHDEQDKTCLACGDGYQLKNNQCVNCTFGFGGFNCTNFYKLIAIVVSSGAGGLLLILIIALIVTCCKKDKNDINKIIFRSGDVQMSPYADFPKSNRVSMEWGRETIEMQENGSTKNLLQMTDIYYSPALRNSDLERNGLYPFSAPPGSRHSCIYPAQWNPSFICDDSRRRDYF